MGCNNSVETKFKRGSSASSSRHVAYDGRSGYSSTGFYRDASSCNRSALLDSGSHPPFRFTVSDCDTANLAAAASALPAPVTNGCSSKTSTMSGCDSGVWSRGGSGSSNNGTAGGHVTGRSVSMVQQQSMLAWNDDPYADGREIVVLTAQQKRVIIANWRILKTDLVGRGSRIFQLIFARNPRVRALFACGHLDEEQMPKDPRFIAHATRFMQAVGAVVDNLDNYVEVLGPLLNDLGRRHVHFKGFKPIYFNDFQESIMQVFADDLGSKFNAQAREAWRLVLLFILTELKRGFTQSLRERSQKGAQSQSPTSTPVKMADDSTASTSCESFKGTCQNATYDDVISAAARLRRTDFDIKLAALQAGYKAG